MSDVANSQRQIIKIIKELSAELGLEMKTYSFDWIIQLSDKEKNMFIYGYQFPCNDASAQLICTDKGALYEVLNGNGISCVEHFYFMSPSMLFYTGENGIWERLSALLKKYGTLVLKRNRGSGGNGIFLASNQEELERVAFELFRQSRDIAVSPYYKISDEYRIIYCYGSPVMAYRKVRPSVIGDGKRNIAALATEKYGEGFEIGDERLNKTSVPPCGETVYLNWKHNLGQGASAEKLDTSTELYGKLTEIAKKCAETVNLSFASIDIVDIDGSLRVLEINSGIMMESFSLSKEDYPTAKAIYRKAIEKYFNK